MITESEIRNALNVHTRVEAICAPFISSDGAASLAAALIIADAIKESSEKKENKDD